MNLEFFFYNESSKLAEEALQIFGPTSVLPFFVLIIVSNIKLFAKKRKHFPRILLAAIFV